MRQKPPSEETIAKYYFFLTSLQNHCKDAEPFKIGTIIKDANVSSQASTSAKAIGIIKQDAKKTYVWMANDPDRALVLKLLDHMLHKNKKQVHVPLMPELATTVGLLDKISTKLDNTTALLDVAVRRLKNGQNQEVIISGQDQLFADQQQYHKDFVYLAGQIAAGVYPRMLKTKPIQHDDGLRTVENDYDGTNEMIITATTDLLNKINNLNNGKLESSL